MANKVRARKAGKRGVRYSAAQKAKILAAAQKEGLTGEQIASRFGVSKLTFYRWRGPVRSDALERRGKRGRGRPKGSKNRVAAGTGIGNAVVREAAVRAEIRNQIRKLLPQIIREEIAAALKSSS